MFQGIDALRALVLIRAVTLLSVVNLRTGMIPDRVTLPLMLLGIVTSVFTSGSLAGLIARGGVEYGVNQATHDGIGSGTIKMAAMVGAFLRWKLASVDLALATVAGVVWAGVFLVTGRPRQTGLLPSAPWLAAGAIASLLWG